MPEYMTQRKVLRTAKTIVNCTWCEIISASRWHLHKHTHIFIHTLSNIRNEVKHTRKYAPVVLIYVVRDSSSSSGWNDIAHKTNTSILLLVIFEVCATADADVDVNADADAACDVYIYTYEGESCIQM